MLRPCHSSVFTGALFASTLLAAGLLTAAPALACGGAFCSSIQPVAVEQNAERILFEINPKGFISTTVEISYTGDPNDFAWVVPVPSAPDLEVTPGDVLLRMDDATSPILNGQRTRCGQSGQRFGGCDTGGGLALAPVAASASLLGCASAGYDGDYFEGDGYDGVDVQEYEQVGPYDPRVVSSDDPAALIDWLNTNGYFVNEAMEPYIASYVLSGSSFLAMRLAPDAGTSDIAPIRMTYPGKTPMIPLILTAVAAEPEMSILAFIAGDSRYQSGNYANVLMDPAWLRYDPFGFETNYFAVSSWLADRVGGHAFFTEYAGPVAWTSSFDQSESEQWLTDLAGRNTNLTRMFTRLSAWEMDVDPIFEPSAGGDVPNTIDLGGNEPFDNCNDTGIGACGGTYCGPGAQCATTFSGDACVCPEGWLARQIINPGAAGAAGLPTVTCQDAGHDLFSTEDLGVTGPCSDSMCGSGGSCVELNGFPTCQCDEGFAAVGMPGNSAPVCEAIIDTFDPEQALVGGSMDVGFAALDTPTKGRRGLEILLGLCIVAVPLIRRRRT